MIERLLGDQGTSPHEIDAIAVTAGPGLVGALLIGVETAKALSLAWKIPVFGVHHGVGHLLSVGLDGAGPTLHLSSDGQILASSDSPDTAAESPTNFPLCYLGLVVSGGHCSLIEVEDGLRFRILGETIDDAPGECFDKVAKLLKLGFPGGPALEKAATAGNPFRFDLPRPLMKDEDDLRFSFSGLKTAVVTLVQQQGGVDKVLQDPHFVADLCACVQEVICEVLVEKSRRALRQHGAQGLAVVGGVACNGRLRQKLGELAQQERVAVAIPSSLLCTDNAAMIARAGWILAKARGFVGDALQLDARAEWPLNEASYPPQ
jgi:N6-L-threonylcarbamoyladenine synthase